MYSRLADTTVHGLQNHLNLSVQDAVHGLSCLPFTISQQMAKPMVSIVIVIFEYITLKNHLNIVYLQEITEPQKAGDLLFIYNWLICIQ